MFINLLDFIGTLAFAISGFRLASSKKFDWFGAYVIGMVTACGGGTLRDVLLDTKPFWMVESSYLVLTAVAMVLVIIFRPYLNKLASPLFLFDTIGLGFFVIVGIEKTLNHHYPWWVAIIMGTMTGSFGGVLRDILINEVPLIFRKEIYASACLVGGFVYFGVLHYTGEGYYPAIAGSTAIILTRMLAQKYNIALPTMKSEDE